MEADLEEGTALLSPTPSELATKSPREWAAAAATLVAEDSCVSKYDPVDLTSLGTLGVFKGSIFAQRAMWYVMALMLSITGGLAVLVVELIWRNPQVNAQSFSTQTISSVISTVTVAMAFLLGLFVNNAMIRWWDTIKRFEALFGAIKRLNLLLINLNAPIEMRHEVCRRGVLSIEMLRFEKLVTKMEGAEHAHWQEMFADLRSQGHMTEVDQTVLEKVASMQRSFFVWSLLAKTVKPLQKTADRQYRDVYKCVQDGMSAVSALKTTSNFMFPFLYVHMLAWLVHMVNFLTAISSGVTIGIVIARYQQAAALAAAAGAKDAPALDGSIIFKEFLFLFIQVFLYQAFLAIGCALSYPVVPRGHGAMYRLPLQEMISAQRKQLETMNTLAEAGLL